MPSPELIVKTAETVALAAARWPGIMALAEDIGLPVRMVAQQVEAGANRAVMSDYVRRELAQWAEKANLPQLDIVRHWTPAQLRRDAAFEMAVKRPALVANIHGGNLNVLELGASWDVTVPTVLDKQLARYTAVDLHHSPSINNAWQARLKQNLVDASNKFRLVGNGAELPIASASQDVVYAGYLDTLTFGNQLPAALKASTLSEIHRVLKPAGKLLLQPFPLNEERLGQAVLQAHFPAAHIHTPGASDLAAIKQTERSSQYQRYVENGFYRTFVGIKK